MDDQEYIAVGRILKPHGLKGEVTIRINDDAPVGLSDMPYLLVDTGQQMLPFVVERIVSVEAKAYVKLEEVDSLADAEKISKKIIYIPKSLRPNASTNDFYDDEVPGFEVADEQIGDLGKVLRVDRAGANRLLVVSFNERELLIPVNAPFITSLDKISKKIRVLLPDGFLDI